MNFKENFCTTHKQVYNPKIVGCRFFLNLKLNEPAGFDLFILHCHFPKRMNPRKRAASDTLFQTRATKHLRRTRERYIGRGNATPSQQEGLAAQWMRLWGQTRK